MTNLQNDDDQPITPLHRHNSSPKTPRLFSATSNFFNDKSLSTAKLDSLIYSELDFHLQTPCLPVILGDHYELAETVALQYTGEVQGSRLAKAEYRAALLPMTDYVKPECATMNRIYATKSSQEYSSLAGYNARRPSQNPTCLQFALPGAAEKFSQQPSPACDRRIDHMLNGISAEYQPCRTFEATLSNHRDIKLHNSSVQILDCKPRSGIEGTAIHIFLKSNNILLSSPPPKVTLMFAECPVATASRLEQDEYYNFLVSAKAPAFAETGFTSLKIPLHLQIEGQSGSVSCGDWTYEDSMWVQHGSSSAETSGARKFNNKLLETPLSTKNVMSSEQQTVQSQWSGQYLRPSANPQTIEFSNMQRRFTPYARSQHLSIRSKGSRTTQPQEPIGRASSRQLVMRHPVSHISRGTVPYEEGHWSSKKPPPSPMPPSPASSILSPIHLNPIIFRKGKKKELGLPVAPAGTFLNVHLDSNTLNPQQIVDAEIEIRGNLNSMMENWSSKERDVNRRLVRFRRIQNGSTIIVYFRPVRADEEPLPEFETQDAASWISWEEKDVSCIYWEETDDCYLTSPDGISLLHFLIGPNFGLKRKWVGDEQNRLRRNLEQYSPCTVTKSATETASFFATIVSLVKPRPWRIKKSVKVFRWSTLEQALRKVFGKYSAVYLRPENFRSGGEQSSDEEGEEGEEGDEEEGGGGGEEEEEEGEERLHSACLYRSTSSSPSSDGYALTPESFNFPTSAPPHSPPSLLPASYGQSFTGSHIMQSHGLPTWSSQHLSDNTTNSPYALQGSMPNPSSAYTASSMGPGGGPANAAASSSHYIGGTQSNNNPINNNGLFGGELHAWQGLNGPTATLGLPHRASVNHFYDALARYESIDAFDAADPQYRRASEIKDEGEMIQPKQE